MKKVELKDELIQGIINFYKDRGKDDFEVQFGQYIKLLVLKSKTPEYSLHMYLTNGIFEKVDMDLVGIHGKLICEATVYAKGLNSPVKITFNINKDKGVIGAKMEKI